MTQIRHIVFDIGSVLIHWDPELIYLDLIDDAEQRKDFLQNVCSPAWNVEQDRGRDWTVAEDTLIRDHPELSELIRAYRRHWIKSIPHAFDDVAELFSALIRSEYDVTLLTNFNHETYPEAKLKFDFLSSARGETVSGAIGLLKPASAIFDHHTNTFDLTPADTLFIDDSAKNVAGAQEVGWHAVQFAGREGAAKLALELEGHGIKI